LVITVAAMVSVQLYGLRVYNLATTKIKATTSGRETVNDIRDRVRSAQLVYVGTYNGTFTNFASGLPQVGNALQIFPTTNTAASNAIVFYQDSDTANVNMILGGKTTVEANFVTNNNIFKAQDFQGNILTNYQNNPVIYVELDFDQLAFPMRSGNLYDYYRLHSRFTVRIKN
jgi:hypothetical protein